MARDPLGLFADVEEDRSVARPTRGSPSVELLDPQRLVADGWLRREIPMHVVEADHRELRAESLRLLGIEREDDDWRAERNDRADPDRDALHVLQYERCRLDPRRELTRTLAFLGLDDFEPPAALLQYGANLTQGTRYQPEPRVREAFIDTLSGDLSRLLADFPEIDPDLWPSCQALG